MSRARKMFDSTPKDKPNKVAVVACMRKLLTILNVMVRESKCWKAPYTTPRNTKVTMLAEVIRDR